MADVFTCEEVLDGNTVLFPWSAAPVSNFTEGGDAVLAITGNNANPGTATLQAAVWNGTSMAYSSLEVYSGRFGFQATLWPLSDRRWVYAIEENPSGSGQLEDFRLVVRVYTVDDHGGISVEYERTAEFGNDLQPDVVSSAFQGAIEYHKPSLMLLRSAARNWVDGGDPYTLGVPLGPLGFGVDQRIHYPDPAQLPRGLEATSPVGQVVWQDPENVHPVGLSAGDHGIFNGVDFTFAALASWPFRGSDVFRPDRTEPVGLNLIYDVGIGGVLTYLLYDAGAIPPSLTTIDPLAIQQVILADFPDAIVYPDGDLEGQIVGLFDVRFDDGRLVMSQSFTLGTGDETTNFLAIQRGGDDPIYVNLTSASDDPTHRPIAGFYIGETSDQSLIIAGGQGLFRTGPAFGGDGAGVPVRKWPRDDAAGYSGATRVYPPPKNRRVVGRYQ